MILELGGRSAYVDMDSLNRVFELLRPVNRVACSLALQTGLRIDDVLSLRKADLEQCVKNNYWLCVVEQKTGKARKIKMDKRTVSQLMSMSGAVYVFEHKSNPDKHRVRQTVYKDFKRCAREVLGVKTDVSVHSIRKVYAVRKYRETGDLARVQKSLNHSNMATTVLYALADKMP